MKIKRILSLVLAVMLFASVTAGAKSLEFTMGEKNMYESDGKIESFEIENAPYTKNDRTMVPVRIISERFGALVEWDEPSGTVTISKDDKVIVLTLGSSEALVNGEAVALDAAPEEFNGRTMVPLRFISETLGMNVDYVESTEQILITDEEPIMTVNGINVSLDDYKSVLTFAGYTPDQSYMIEDYIDFANGAFVELYSSAAYLNSLGVYPPETYSQEVESSLAPYKEEIYKTALTAPIAKLLANDYFIADFVYTYTETEEAQDEALILYEKEFVTAKHILVLADDDKDKATAKKEAQEILKKIKSGEDFDTLMNEFCEDPGLVQYPNGYTFTKGEMVPEFEQAAFALEEGKVSDIIETSYGYHIIKREPLAELDSGLYSYLMEMVAGNVYEQIMSSASDAAQVEYYKTKDELIEIFK